MIIDVHGHLCASPKLYAWFTLLLASRASYGTPPPPISDDEMLALVETRRNLDAIDGAGTDVQLISPPPCSMFHAERPGRVVHRWIEGVNSYIAQFCLARVCLDFPELRLSVPPGRGSVRSQVGRWRAERLRPVIGKSLPLKESFDEGLRRLYYDTVLHSKEALAMLIRLVGADRVVFGTENPGSGTALNPQTGRSFDDIKALLDELDFLTPADRANILEQNARRLFPRLKAKGGAPAPGTTDAKKYLSAQNARVGIGM